MAARLSIWLLPGPELHQVLAAAIAEIAASLAGPPFPPHVTVLGDFLAEPDDVEEAVAAQAAGTWPVVLAPTGVATSAKRFEALTVRFAAAEPLRALAGRLASALEVPLTAAPDPHLSLAYPPGNFDPAALGSLARAVPLGGPYTFTALAVVDPGEGRGDWHDVSAWRTLRTEPLR
jgi:hypothetical protein